MSDPHPPEPVTDEPAGSLEEDYWQEHKKQKGRLYSVAFFLDWCKACGLCAALCPRKIILRDETGKPRIEVMDRCTGCRFCQIHCPDFAITVKDRYPDRRRVER